MRCPVSSPTAPEAAREAGCVNQLDLQLPTDEEARSCGTRLVGVRGTPGKYLAAKHTPGGWKL